MYVHTSYIDFISSLCHVFLLLFLRLLLYTDRVQLHRGSEFGNFYPLGLAIAIEICETNMHRECMRLDRCLRSIRARA